MGLKTTSTTVYSGRGERIDVENPNPGQRPGQIHYQDSNGNKYLCDPQKNEFVGASKSLNKRLLGDQGIVKGIQKALKVLGELQ
jgi:filamentous hemagglutinin